VARAAATVRAYACAACKGEAKYYSTDGAATRNLGGVTLFFFLKKGIKIV
jgi:hypothetical protein